MRIVLFSIRTISRERSMTASAFILGAGFGTRLRPLTPRSPQTPDANPWATAHRLRLGKSSESQISGTSWSTHTIFGSRWHNGLKKTKSKSAWSSAQCFRHRRGIKNRIAKTSEKVIIWNGDILCDVSASELLDNCPEDGAIMALRHSAQPGKDDPVVA